MVRKILQKERKYDKVNEDLWKYQNERDGICGGWANRRILIDLQWGRKLR